MHSPDSPFQEAEPPLLNNCQKRLLYLLPGHLTLDSPSPGESVPAPLMRGLYKGRADDGSIHWSLFPSPTSRTSLALYHTHLGMMVFKSVLLYNSIDTSILSRQFLEIYAH